MFENLVVGNYMDLRRRHGKLKKMHNKRFMRFTPSQVSLGWSDH